MKPSRFNVFVPLSRREEGGDYILYNALSDSILQVDDELKVALEAAMLDLLEITQLKVLADLGVIVDDDMNELSIYAYRNRAKTYSQFEYEYSVFVTRKCNLACNYCALGVASDSTDEQTGDEGTLSAPMASQLFKFIADQTQTVGSRVVNIRLLGGEPLLDSATCLDLENQLSRWASSKGLAIMTALVTNGTLLTQKRLDEWSKFLTAVQVTFEGDQTYHDRIRRYPDGRGTYRDVMNSIALLSRPENKILTSIRTHVSKENLGLLPALFEDLKSYEIHNDQRFNVQLFPAPSERINMCSMFPALCLTGRACDEASAQETSEVLTKAARLLSTAGFRLKIKPTQTYRQLPCPFSLCYSQVLDFKGDVYKCLGQLNGKSGERAAYINENGFLVGHTKHLYDFTGRDAATLSRCSQCQFLPICGGGCAYKAYKQNGTYLSHSCGATKQLVPENLRLCLKLSRDGR